MWTTLELAFGVEATYDNLPQVFKDKNLFSLSEEDKKKPELLTAYCSATSLSINANNTISWSNLGFAFYSGVTYDQLPQAFKDKNLIPLTVNKQNSVALSRYCIQKSNELKPKNIPDNQLDNQNENNLTSSNTETQQGQKRKPTQINELTDQPPEKKNRTESITTTQSLTTTSTQSSLPSTSTSHSPAMFLAAPRQPELQITGEQEGNPLNQTEDVRTKEEPENGSSSYDNSTSNITPCNQTSMRKH